MKHILFLLLFPAALFAQDQPDTTAVTYENRGGIFYTVTKTTYQSGKIITEEVPVASDTNAITSAIIGPIYRAATILSSSAVKVARIQKLRSEISNANTSLLQLVSKDYFDLLNESIGSEFLADSAQLKPVTMQVNGGALITASIRRNASGKLVYRQGSQNFLLDIVSRNWIRIRRYDGSDTITPEVSAVDLFKEAPNRWISLDLKYILRQ